MNHIYRIVWNATLGVWQAVGEVGKGLGKSKSHARRNRMKQAGLALALFMSGGQLYAAVLPQGAQVTAGAANISTNGNTMNVVQSSDKAAINWQSFNVGKDAAVNFQQPNAGSVALNRVVGNETSVIQGALNANGQIFLLNSNGVLFTKDAQVNTGGLVASTLNISDADFMAGKTIFSANGSKASIINLGTITAKEGGYVALLGNNVTNEGVITAKMGSAVMAAGDKVSLNFNGNSLVGVTVDEGTLNALVANKNAVIADGGLVVMTAKGLDEVMRTVVNNTGEVRAQTIQEKNGKIYLLGGMENDRIEVDGKLDASAPTTGDGGFIETSAANVVLKETKQVTTKAKTGKTGTFLIDPNDYTIAASGGDITGTQLGTDLANNNVVIQSTSGASGSNGDVNVNDAVTWSSNNSLTLNAQRNININADITATGATAKLSLEYGQGAVAANNTADYNIKRGATVNLHAGQNFSTKLGSDGTAIDYTVIDQMGTQNAGTLGGNFAIGANGNLAGVTFTSTDNFTGRLTGLGHTISNITSTTNGLFKELTGATVRDLALDNFIINSTQNDVGALAGKSINSTIKNITVQNSALLSSGSNIGGLVGYAINGTTISNSYATANVEGTSSTAGGLVGLVEESTVRNSYAAGSVSNTGNAGGLIGLLLSSSSASVENSYSISSVTAAVNGTVGGLVGQVIGGTSSVTNSYASGLVTGASGSNNGGAIGFTVGSPTFSNVYWDTTTTDQANSAGGTGIANANAYTQANYTGFDFTSSGAWFSVDGYTRPFLRMEASNTITNAHELQLMSINLGNSYKLANNINLAPSLTNASEMWKDNSASVDFSNFKGSFVPVGNGSNQFTGNFDGLGHILNNLTINQPTGMFIGLFGFAINASISNVGIVGGTVDGQQFVGSLVGRNRNSTVTNAYSTASVTGGAGSGTIGGLVGMNDGGTITNAYATGAVIGISSLGGLVGQNDAGTITNSYATGSVTGVSSLGGLAGYNNNATISNSYATGTVTGTQNYIGGLVGDSLGTSQITNTYATGTVAGTNDIGGLIGRVTGTTTTTTNSFWDKATTGQAASAGGTGKTTAEMHDILTYRGTDSTNPVWDIAAADVTNPYPTLRWTTTGLTGTSVWVMPYQARNSVFDSSILENSGTTTANSVSGVTGTLTLANNQLSFTGTGTYTPTQQELTAGYIADDFVASGVKIQDSNTLNIEKMFFWNGYNLTLSAAQDINVKQLLGTTGATDKLTLEYGQGAVAANNTADYDFGLTSTGFTGRINLHQGQNFSTKLGSDGTAVNYTVINGATNSDKATALQNINNSLAGNYALGCDVVDLTGVTWTPVGTFTGKFTGLGHIVDNLTLNIPSNNGGGDRNSNSAGLFGVTNGAVIRDIGVTNANISSPNAGNGIGILVGKAENTNIINAYSTGSVVAGYMMDAAGGLVGYIINGTTISNSYSTASVDDGAYAGGLVGYSQDSSVKNSYASGSVSNSSYVGGLIGQFYVQPSNAGSVENTYAIGSVTAKSWGIAGGLIGSVYGPASVSNSYASGAVTGAANSTNGGAIGSTGPTTSGPTVSNVYWDATTTGQAASAGGTGKTTAEMKTFSIFSGTNPAWDIVTDSSLSNVYPQLRWATTGLSAGSSVWVIGKVQITYYVSGGSRTYGQTFTLPTPSFTGGSPTGTPTVKVYDAQNNDVTAQATAGTLPAGSYAVKTELTDTDYMIASSGNTDGTLTISAPYSPPPPRPTSAPTEPPTSAPTEPPTEPPTSAPTEPPTSAPTEPPTSAPTEPPTSAPTEPPTLTPEQQQVVENIIVNVQASVSAVVSSANTITQTFAPSPVVTTTTGSGNAGGVKSFSNVVSPPVTLNNTFGQGTPLAIISAPNGDEPTQTVSLSEAKAMLGSGTTGTKTTSDSTTDSSTEEGDREVRVPVSRNSLAEIVNGGVKLPSGVEQQLFVVKGN